MAVDEISKRENLPIGIMIRFGERVRTEQFAFRTVLFVFLSFFPSFYALIYYWFTKRILSNFLVREGQRMFFTTKVNEKLRRNSRKLFIIRFNVTAKTSADFSHKRCNIKSSKPSSSKKVWFRATSAINNFENAHLDFTETKWKPEKNNGVSMLLWECRFSKYSLNVENFKLYPTKMNGSISDFA